MPIFYGTDLRITIVPVGDRVGDTPWVVVGDRVVHRTLGIVVTVTERHSGVPVTERATAICECLNRIYSEKSAAPVRDPSASPPP